MKLFETDNSNYKYYSGTGHAFEQAGCPGDIII